MVQDVRAVFGLGYHNKTIGTVDADGIALAAIQGLYQLVREKDAEIAALKSDRISLQQRIGDLEARLAVLEKAIESQPAAGVSPEIGRRLGVQPSGCLFHARLHWWNRVVHGGPKEQKPT